MKIRILDRYEPKNKTLSFMIGVKVKKRILSFQNNLLTQYSNASFFVKRLFRILTCCALSDIFSDYKKGNKGKDIFGSEKERK